MKPLFVVLEGPDASGKSTQLELLAQALADRGIPALPTREPGGTALGEKLRDVLLARSSTMRPLTELLLMVADRHEHVETVIRPALNDGTWVLCSRYVLSSMAYQGIARGLGLETVQELNALATGGLQPDFTFLLDLPPDVAFDRTRERDRFEGEGLAFYTSVREAYLRLFIAQPGGHIVDGTLPPDILCQRILAHLPLP